MRLYVMRHGPAEDRARSGRDGDRVLTPAGRDVVRRAAQALRAERGADLQHIVASPLSRARETAEIVASVVGTPALEISIDDALEPEGSPLRVAEALARRGVDALLVGHQPDVEILVRALAGSAPPSGFRTAMIATLEAAIPGGSAAWQLRSVIDPHG